MDLLNCCMHMMQTCLRPFLFYHCFSLLVVFLCHVQLLAQSEVGVGIHRVSLFGHLQDSSFILSCGHQEKARNKTKKPTEQNQLASQQPSTTLNNSQSHNSERIKIALIVFLRMCKHRNRRKVIIKTVILEVEVVVLTRSTLCLFLLL